MEIDATSHTLDISSFGLGITKPSQEEDDDGTDALVDSALLSEKPRPPDRESLTDVMQRENNLIRLTGIKQIVFDNLRTKYLSMTPAMQTALRHFVVFPRSFNLHAATSVAGLNDADLVRMQGMLDSMIHTNFVTTTKGRYEINEAARLFLNEDDTVFNDNLISNTLDVAQKRFINHFKTQLGQLQDDRIHTKGFWREQAMALYDSERDNMEFSEYLLNGRNSDLREFLSAGITVMRYCVSAADRERLLRKALSEDDTSTENIFLSLGLEAPTASTSSTETALHGAGPVGFDRAHRARLYLALSEALFDQLKMEEAENPLKCADELTRDLCQQLPRNGEVTPWGIVDSVLVNLLMSNLRFGTNRFKEAQGYCVRALTTLRDAGLGRSTFGINAMSNLVQCYLSAGRLDKAKSVAGKLLDTLNEMRYTGMPIYADALGVCAMVSMAEHNYSEAERQYGTAVETVHTWGSKEWTGVPLQHCMDLDLWLMEGLADAIQSQGRSAEAAELLEKASEIRERRHLPETPLVSKDDQEEMIQTERDLKSRSSLRHLY